MTSDRSEPTRVWRGDLPCADLRKLSRLQLSQLGLREGLLAPLLPKKASWEIVHAYDSLSTQSLREGPDGHGLVGNFCRQLSSTFLAPGTSDAWPTKSLPGDCYRTTKGAVLITSDLIDW